MISPDGDILTWNPGVKRLLGYEESEFVGKPFSLIFTDEDRKLNVPESELMAVEKTGKAEDERWHRRKDDTVFWANGLVTLMKDPNGTVQGFTKIMRDQTQKKQFEERMAEQANALAVANTELTNFRRGPLPRFKKRRCKRCRALQIFSKSKRGSTTKQRNRFIT